MNATVELLLCHQSPDFIVAPNLGLWTFQTLVCGLQNLGSATTACQQPVQDVDELIKHQYTVIDQAIDQWW